MYYKSRSDRKRSRGGYEKEVREEDRSGVGPVGGGRGWRKNGKSSHERQRIR